MKWIQQIAQAITTILKTGRLPVKKIPPILLLCEILNRPGLSAIALTASVITRLDTSGIPTEVNPCGMENMNNKFVKIFAEETIKHIKTYAKVESVPEINSLSFIGSGANMGGPVTLTMYNNNNPNIGGLVQ